MLLGLALLHSPEVQQQPTTGGSGPKTDKLHAPADTPTRPDLSDVTRRENGCRSSKSRTNGKWPGGTTANKLRFVGLQLLPTGGNQMTKFSGCKGFYTARSGDGVDAV
jgi:hypothetical protein